MASLILGTGNTSMSSDCALYLGSDEFKPENALERFFSLIERNAKYRVDESYRNWVITWVKGEIYWANVGRYGPPPSKVAAHMLEAIHFLPSALIVFNSIERDEDKDIMETKLIQATLG